MKIPEKPRVFQAGESENLPHPMMEEAGMKRKHVIIGEGGVLYT